MHKAITPEIPGTKTISLTKTRVFRGARTQGQSSSLTRNQEMPGENEP